MQAASKKTIERLKDIIDRNGPKYLTTEPYATHQEILKSKSADKKTAGAILCVLVSDVLKNIKPEDNRASLSKTIREECGFNKAVADHLATVFLGVYSAENKMEWKSKKREGLSQFLQKDFVCSWKGFAVWDEGNGTVDCHYNAEIVLSPTELVAKEEKLKQKLRKNPFLKKEAIHQHFEKRIQEYLDYKFEDYCRCEDYYQPVVEDFEIDYHVSEWSKQNGFEVISCEGDGEDGGYEPTFRGRWY